MATEPRDDENPPLPANIAPVVAASSTSSLTTEEQRNSQRIRMGLDQIPPKLLGIRQGVVSGAPVPPTPASVLDPEDPSSAAESDALLAEGLSRTGDKKRSHRRLMNNDTLMGKLGLVEPDAEGVDWDVGKDDKEDPFEEGGEEKVASAVIGLCGCIACCIIPLFVALIAAGSWLIQDPDTENRGYACFTAAGVLLGLPFLACCTMCFGSCLACAVAGAVRAESGNDSSSDFKSSDPHQRPKKATYVFKRLNDAFELETKQHDSLVKSALRKLPKHARSLMRSAQQQYNQTQVKEERVMDELVSSKIEGALEKAQQEAPNGAAPDPSTVLRSLRRRVYVIDFHSAGVGKAALLEAGGEDNSEDEAVVRLRDHVTLVLKVADPKIDQVVFRITSPGGPVTTYGAASSHLVRMKNAGFRTTACVDEMAASGGYMLATVCDRIVAAPFALLGSIGVVAYVPNFQRLTRDKLNVDVYRFTAGKHKRTVDMFGDVEKEDKDKMNEDLGRIHWAFKEHVRTFRGDRIKSMETVATGDAWMGLEALELGLVDEIGTSDEVIAKLTRSWEVFSIVERQNPKSRWPSFGDPFGSLTSMGTKLKSWASGAAQQKPSLQLASDY